MDTARPSIGTRGRGDRAAPAERTLLAYLRTCLALGTVGLLLGRQLWATPWAAVIVTAAALALPAAVYAAAERRCRAVHAESGAPSPALVGAVAALGTAVAVVGVVSVAVR